jgi:hypothetical protein
MKNTYELTVYNWSKGQEPQQTITFEGLQSVWNYLGFKLIRGRYGYGGMRGNIGYTLLKVR